MAVTESPFTMEQLERMHPRMTYRVLANLPKPEQKAALKLIYENSRKLWSRLEAEEMALNLRRHTDPRSAPS